MPDMRKINQHVISEFRANDGRLSGPMEGAPILLLTTKGNKTGAEHTTPVGFIDAGGRLAIAGSNGGADTEPDWIRNIRAQGPEASVTIEVPGAAITAKAELVADPERSELLDQMASTLPGMSDHLAATARAIPVVLLTEA